MVENKTYRLGGMGQRGFSLVEMMVVIAVIGILSTIVIGATSTSRANARDNRRLTDLKIIQLGLALYYDVNKAYPSGTDTTVLVTPLIGDKYLPEIPTDPKTGGSYEYTSIGTPVTGYCLGANVENLTIPPENAVGVCTTTGTVNYKIKK